MLRTIRTDTGWVENLKYRADIDGLRAVAVLSVVAYHIGKSVGFNGFLGVDIFFVISGYLITTIIMQAAAEGNFTFRHFYERRIRRIVPVLLVVLTATTVVAVGLFLPTELYPFSRSLLSALLFSSNILFYMETGYFDADADMKPLLHTWSLSVEEQFYIVFPILLLFALKRGSAFTKVLFGSILVFTLLWNLTFPAIFKDTSFAFYMFPVRAWELLIGAALPLGLVPRNSYRVSTQNILGLAGLALILAGFIPKVSEQVPYALYTLPTALGTALILYAGESPVQGVLNRVLGHKWLVFNGKISYSMYLWHWPIFVFALYYSFGRLSDPERFTIFLITFLISVFSWKYIEQPFRKRSSKRVTLLGASAGCMLAVSLAGTSLYLVNVKGILPTLPPEIVLLATPTIGEPAAVQTEKDGESFGVLGASNKKEDATIVLMGDSHAEAIRPALHIAAKANSKTVISRGNACISALAEFDNLPILGDCAKSTREQLRNIVENPKIETVVIAQRWLARTNDWNRKSFLPLKDIWKYRSDSLLDVVKQLQDAGKNVVILAQVPRIEARFHNVPSAIARMEMWHDSRLDTLAPTYERYLKVNEPMLQILERIERETGAAIVYPSDILCTGGTCQTHDSGGSYYFDDDHLSTYGARKLSGLFDGLL